MWPQQKRWMGNKGMYFPGVGEYWRSVNGITRGVVQEEINVDVLQILINNEKPQSLPGADDTSIQVASANSTKQSK